MPIISDIIVQLNYITHQDYLKLPPSRRVKTKPVDPQLVTLTTICMPNEDLIECNRTALYRVLRDLNYEGSKYKEAKASGQVRIIKLINPKPASGLNSKSASGLNPKPATGPWK